MVIDGENHAAPAGTFARLDPEPKRTVVNRSDAVATILIVSAPRTSGYTPMELGVKERVTAACVQVEPAILDRAGTIDRVAERTAEAAAQGAQLVVFPETFVPAYPSSAWAKALAGWAEPGAKEAFALLHRESLEVPSADADRLAGIAREHGVWLVVGVNESDPRAAGHALQLAPLLLAGGRARAPPPQARADEPRAARLGPGRRARPARARDAARPHRRPDLLGELHAARALLALRVGRRDLRRVDGGRRRPLAGDADAHRARVALVRDRAEPLPARRLVSGRLPAASACSRAATCSAAAAPRSSLRTGATSPGRSTTRRESSTPSSTRTCSCRRGSASTRPATTTGRTCSS